MPCCSPGVFPTWGSNLSLLHCRQFLYHLSHQRSSIYYTVMLRLNAKNLIGSPLVQGPDVLFLSVCLLLFSQPVVSASLQPHEYSTPGLPVPHCLPKFAQVHVHCIGDTILPSHPLTLSSPCLSIELQNLANHLEKTSPGL